MYQQYRTTLVGYPSSKRAFSLRLASLFLLATALLFAAGGMADAATWQMRGHDIWNSGRADFSVPADRQNGNLLNIFAWQTPSPGSPNEGNLSTTQMTFFDGVGPSGKDIVVGGYHWPKGVQAMDRHTGAFFWSGNPGGGESIGTIAPAFSNNGHTIYVMNDGPSGPLMAFAATTGPSAFWDNSEDPYPWQLSGGSPKVSPDGRIFMHCWSDRIYGGTDYGASIGTSWIAATQTYTCYNQPAIYQDGSTLKVITGGRYNSVVCFGAAGAAIWSYNTGMGTDSDATVDPSNGNIYIAAGNVYVIGLTKDGAALWSPAVKRVYNGSGNAENPGSCGCLGYDGSTYYLHTNSSQGTGKLYAVNTSDGSLKWSYVTGGKGWEGYSSSPIVTQNGIIIVGNNGGGTYYAIRDDGTQGTLIDSFQVDSGGSASASASLSPDGLLYLPLRTLWATPNGGGAVPTQQTANLFTCLDLKSGATSILPPPTNQSAIALNHAVALSWKPVIDASGVFDHYAVYRATSAFTSVAGKTPIATVTGLPSSSYSDSTALNGTHYHYAITTVTTGGGEVKTINSIGPRTPRNETDLQVVSISRTPFYPRFLPIYSYFAITEPSGFGPYYSGAATGLSGGQTAGTKRVPNIGDSVTYTATVRNRGTNSWPSTTAISGTWKVDGATVSSPSQSVTLNPGNTTTFTYVRTWDNVSHDIAFTINVTDARPANNALNVDTKAVGFLTYIDASYLENYRESTSWPLHKYDDLIDWLNSHMVRFNQMFAEANTPKRVHYDILQVINDSDPDPATDTTPFAIFPFRYHAAEGDARGSGYYSPSEDIDYGLLHEEAHQLGLIDIYQLDLGPEANLVSGAGYSAVDCLMRTCAPFLSEFSAYGMTDWQNTAHGYYGQFIYNLPRTMQVRVLGFDGNPLPGATVKMYQKCNRPGLGTVISTQIKAQGTTDSNGIFVLPNVPINQSIQPPVYTGDVLHDNPFGYLDVVGSNGVLYFRAEYNGGVSYFWLDITEAMVAYFRGQTTLATFDKQVSLGGPVQLYPPNDLAEMNANDWTAWAQGTTNNTTTNDTSRKQVGSGSVRFTTDGGFDTSISYPKTETAQWDLRQATTLNIRFYATNTNSPQFQSGSPWILLKDSNGNYFKYQYYSGGGVYDILNQALNNWRSHSIPLNAPVPTPTSTGWCRTTFGTPDLAHINLLEIHADTWGMGFSLWVDGVNFAFPTPPKTTINAIKTSLDNTRADITSGIVTAVWPDYFYIERPDRSQGIRVIKAAHGLTANQSVRVLGILKTTTDGERAIDASWAAPDGFTGDVNALLMTNKTLGGTDFKVAGIGQPGVKAGVGLNNIGLLVRVFGQVVERDTSPTPTWCKIDDGSDKNIRVEFKPGAAVPALNTFAAVTGISSCYKSGSDLYPKILVP